MSLIDKIIAPYTEDVKKELQVPNDQKSFFTRDAFKGEGTPRVQERLAEIDVVIVMVPKNMTQQALEATTNGTIKKIEKRNSVNISPP